LRVLERWLAESPARWRPVTSSYVTTKVSGRIDRTYTFERSDRRVGGAPIRMDVVIAGREPAEARPYVVVPESFSRRYEEMRSANNLLALLATAGVFVLVIGGALALRRYSRTGRLRWRAPLIVGAVVGVLFLGATLNGLSASWYDYDTATSPVVFLTVQTFIAVFASGFTMLLVTLTLAAAEALTREAFPGHADWWRLWQTRGTREVALSVAGGYAVAAIAFAYVAVFYVVTRRYFGWWVPSELLDSPDQIATPMPWLAGIAISLQAAVWEEALFRAIPLSLLAIRVRDHPHRERWMALGVVATALVFGFAHASYPSWPPYSRGVEIFLDACFWAVLFLRFGLLVTVIAHFVYDLVLFGLFAAAGSGMQYRVTAAVTLLVLAAPALAVAWRWIRQRGLVPFPETERFGAWAGGDSGAVAAASASAPPLLRDAAAPLSVRARQVAIALAVAGTAAAILAPRRESLGPPFTATRARAHAAADSALHTLGIDPGRYRRLSTVSGDTLEAWRRFLREHDSTGVAQRLAGSYAVPAWWSVRYVNTEGSLEERAEEWRVRVRPDGRLLDARHLIPDSAARDTIDPAGARRAARAALAAQGLDTLSLVETRFEETARPARRDVTVTYTDTTVHLPAGAAARAWVTLAGPEPLVVRRGIELPESFLRADRERQVRAMAVAGLAGVVAFGILLFAIVQTVRGRPPVLSDGIGRPAAMVLVAVLIALQVASTLLSLPGMYFGYDTAVPWNRFVSGISVQIVFAGLSALLFVALWAGMNALRRRVGIPIHATGHPAIATRETLVAGLGLGGFFGLVSHLEAFIPAADRVPAGPSTTLDQAIPVLAHVATGPLGAATIVPMFAIAVLAIIGAVHSRTLRFALAFVVLGLLSTAGWVITDRLGPGEAVALVITIALTVALLRQVLAWGRVSVTVWVVAALAAHSLSALALAMRAPTGEERVAGLLSLIVSGALAVFVARAGRRAGAPELSGGSGGTPYP
jgi:hypothetical protein